MKCFIISVIGVLMSQLAFAQGWEPQVSPTALPLNAVVFVDTSNGWAVGDSGSIIHTMDGGGSWAVQTSGTTEPLRSVDFVDTVNGWAVGDSGTIVHTSDGGTTWTIQEGGTDSPLNGVDFVDANSGWTVGGWWDPLPYSTILHTTNGGATWIVQGSGTDSPLRGVDFVDLNNGWAVGGALGIGPGPLDDHEDIVHTTDGGNTWIPQIGDTMRYPIYEVDLVDANNGWAVGGWDTPEGDYRIIDHTSDGGATWTEVITLTMPLLDVVFVDANTGWAVGNSWDGGDAILHTTDAGSTWTSQIVDTAQAMLCCVDFVDANHGWALGSPGLILRYNPNLQTADGHSRIQPCSFSLSTYPNPFNSSTTIAYDLPKAGCFSLRVFDVLGREVAVLANGLAEAGSHRVIFDGSGLASGIYFARLDAGRFSQTKKLMLLK
jgi:photosystem II stability/assembly factor-like uncharacterized protein